MKKMISLACALMMMLGVSAQIRQSAQMTQEDDITSASAYYMKGTTSGNFTYGDKDFNITFADAQNNTVAYVEVTAPSATSLQGTYHLGDGYSMFVAQIYDGETAYPMTHGDLIMICKDTRTQTVQGYGEVTFYIYEVQALNWHNYKTGVNAGNDEGGMEFHGTVALTVQNWQTKAIMTLTDQAMNPTEIRFVGTDFGTTDTGNAFGFVGWDESDQTGVNMVCFSDSILTDAQGNGYYCTQGVYDVDNVFWAQTSVLLNGVDVTTTMTDFMAYIVEDRGVPGNNTKFVASIYVKYNGTWYHMAGVYDKNASGVEEVEAAETEGTAKVMKDGQLIIIRNGVRYNAQGAVIE